MRKSLIALFLLVPFLFLQANQFLPGNPRTAMKDYLNNGDQSFKWEMIDQTKAEGASLYRILFTSQKWRGIEWKHEMTMIVPDGIQYKDALLFITGGSVKNGKPNLHKWDEELTLSLTKVAKDNKTLCAILWQVPNQPLCGDLTEDALISYTLHNYLNDNDLTWPLLFPMTKSAIRGMDVVQQFAKKQINREISNFVISGASKRGWTTWLTGANDPRVKAIAPMVIDVLNMPVNVDYQKKVWGDYSIEIEDYVKLGIAQQFGTPGGNDLVLMVDPYSYRKTLTMPKMIFMGTNDQYWPVDAIKNYIDSIPGNNHICYTPNAGHNLGDKKKAFATLSAFLGNTITTGKYPICKYSVTESDGVITLKVKSTRKILVNAVLWSADSKDQDFRDEKWVSTSLDSKDKRVLKIEVKKPASGFRAFYVDLVYKAPFSEDYTQSTRMFVSTEKQLLAKTR